MKKLNFFIILSIFSVILISCASTPKNSGSQDLSPAETSTEIGAEEKSVTTAPEATSVPEQDNFNSGNETLDSDSKTDSTEAESMQESDDVILEKLDEAEYFLEPEIQVISEENQTEDDIRSEHTENTGLLGGPAVQTQPGIRKSLTSSQKESEVHESDEVLKIETEDAEKNKTADSEANTENDAEKNEDKNSSSKNEADIKQKESPISEKTKASDKKNDAISENNTSQTAENQTAPIAGQAPSQNEEENKADAFIKPVVIIPSREVTMYKNQYLDVIYPGNGWIYIGESENNALFRYFGRKIGSGNTSFTLRSITNGSTLLHFYKNDALTGEYIDDYLQVTVKDEIADSSTKVTAPSYAEVVPAKPVRNSTIFTSSESEESEKKNVVQNSENSAPKETNRNNIKSKESQNTSVPAPQKNQAAIQEEDNNIKTVIQNTKSEAEKTSGNVSSASRTSTPVKIEEKKSISDEGIEKDQNDFVADESLLEKALKAYSEKKYQEALDFAQKYLDFASVRIDEALFLLGQIYESDFPSKNIRNSLDSYEAVVKRFPTSKLWKKANNRAIYLKRFYIDIR